MTSRRELFKPAFCLSPLPAWPGQEMLITQTRPAPSCIPHEVGVNQASFMVRMFHGAETPGRWCSASELQLPSAPAESGSWMNVWRWSKTHSGALFTGESMLLSGTKDDASERRIGSKTSRRTRIRTPRVTACLFYQAMKPFTNYSHLEQDFNWWELKDEGKQC